MDLIDSKYIGLVSSRLQKFKRVKSDLYNFRCPLCGDSQKHKNKARGYVYPVKADMNFKCHNCGASATFSSFLKSLDPILYKQYTFEKFQIRNTGKGSIIEKPKLDFKKPVFKKKLNLPRASEVSIAKEYLERRMIDPTKFYFANNFKKWVNTQKQTFDTIGRDESRIIIPMYDTERNLIGFQGRSLGPNSVKYITVMLKEEALKVYGMDRIDTEKSVYVVEGPFDSTFIDNSIALCGSDGDLEYLKAYDLIYAYDNEPRNKEIVSRIERCIGDNKRVVIWPRGIEQKDINDMVLAGHDIMSVLESNTYSGLEAQVQFNIWKKV
jgi:GTPase SAR1 family protein/predicted RNA-binding Zn-ribbon protein involved in translation (DUF1610 family)